MKSPMSTPDMTDLPDPTVPTTGAIAIAVDQALFALTRALVKSGTVARRFWWPSKE